MEPVPALTRWANANAAAPRLACKGRTCFPPFPQAQMPAPHDLEFVSRARRQDDGATTPNHAPLAIFMLVVTRGVVNDYFRRVRQGGRVQACIGRPVLMNNAS
jgi:hypothetical protein